MSFEMFSVGDRIEEKKMIHGLYIKVKFVPFWSWPGKVHDVIFEVSLYDYIKATVLTV